MSVEFDELVGQYQRSKELPFRVFSEIPDRLELLGDVRGRSVLDLACGEGFYTRLIKKAGADRVVGVDLSGRMIAMVREQEAALPMGIVYLAGPAEGLEAMEPFDVVSAASLLNCAADALEPGRHGPHDRREPLARRPAHRDHRQYLAMAGSATTRLME